MDKSQEWEYVENKLRNLIYSKLTDEHGNQDDFSDDTELVDSGILSSSALIELLVGIENFLDLEIVNDDIGIEDFATVNKIINSVKRSSCIT